MWPSLGAVPAPTMSYGFGVPQPQPTWGNAAACPPYGLYACPYAYVPVPPALDPSAPFAAAPAPVPSPSPYANWSMAPGYDWVAAYPQN